MDARRLFLSGLRDVRQVEGLGPFLWEQFGGAEAASASAAAAQATRRVKRARSTGNKPDGCVEEQQQPQQQKQEQEGEGDMSYDSESDGEGWHEDGTETAFSLCIDDLRQEPLISVLQQLQHMRKQCLPFLRHLQLDLIGINWDTNIISLLQ